MGMNPVGNKINKQKTLITYSFMFEPVYSPREWSQHSRTLDGLWRTTNSAEGWHRRFSSKIACQHPGVFRMLKEVQREEDHVRGEAEKYVAGLPPPARRQRWRVVNERLVGLVRRRHDGDIEVIADFLRGVAHNFTF